MKNIDLRKFGIDKNKIPESIAIIMDGNGRWARQRKFSREEGHKQGVKPVRDIIESCGVIGVKYLVLYTFSEENWRRPITEVNALVNLLAKYLESELDELNRSNVKIRFLGRTNKFPKIVRNRIQNMVEKTNTNTGLNLFIALSYGGKAEIVDATRKIIELGVKKVDEQSIRNYFYCPELPDPELLIRTAGEQRVSNLLLYQIANTEIFITPAFWPDFTTTNLLEAIKWYQDKTGKLIMEICKK